MKVLTCDYKSPDFQEKFVQSMVKTGFAVVVNHDVPKADLDAFYQRWSSIFNSKDLKNIYLFDKKSQAGYFPFKSENAKDSKLKDLKEFWHIYCNRHDWKLAVPLSSESITLRLFKELESVAKTLLTILEVRTPSEYKNNDGWVDSITKSTNTLFRVLHYPPIGLEEVEGMRAAAHEDINLITILPSATAPGLQVKDVDGGWHMVDIEVEHDNALIVNAGDMLQELTNGYYKSTTHRVLNPTGLLATKPRYSMPLFLHPKDDFKLSDRYTANSYLTERLKELGLI